jgi:hypothetical protein
MGLDTSMYNALKPVQIDSPIDAYGKIAQFQQMQNQNKLADLTLQQHQRSLASDNALASLLASGGKPEDVVSGLAQKGFGERAMAFQKQQQELAKQGAEVAKDKATAQKTSLEAANIALTQHRAMLNNVNDINGAAQWLVTGYQNPDTKPIFERFGPMEEALRRLQASVTDPASFQKWKMGASMNADDLVKYTTPDANTVATNATSRANNAATNATSRANNAATQAAENLRAGVMPGGGLDDNAERTAQAIAGGQLPAPTGMALLNPKNQRILGRVMEINPSYDASTVSAKKAAATAFTSGQQGNAMRSFAVAGQHLDQLGQLADAMNNGNSQLVNKIANAYSQQSGSPAVTNFDAAKDVVSKEVVKAIVAGGGGVAEREELAKLMSNAKSPAQLKGVITQYRNLMAAQHDALLQQRRAAGLPDSTMPNYTQPEAASTGVPADIAALLKKHGGK